MERIAELRKICQTGRESAIYKMNFFDRNFSRWLSIYFTKLFLKMGMSANDVTFVDLLFVIGAGVCFLNPNPFYWFCGIGLFLLYLVLDCSDGEVARYNEAKGRRKPQPLGLGALLGGVVDWFTWPYLFACMSFGIYFATGNLMIFPFGFLAVIMRSLYLDMGLMPYPILHEKGLLAKAVRGNSKVNLGESKLMGLGRVAFGIQGFIPAILAVALIDYFSPADSSCSIFRVDSIALDGGGLYYVLVNARFIYLVVFGLGALVGVLLKIRDAFRYGVRIQRI